MTQAIATEEKARKRAYEPDDEIIPPRHLRKVVGFSSTTAWRLRKRGDFPEPIRLSPGRVGWLKSALQEWLARRAASTK
jgi:prophage regulatory protein